MVGKRVCEVDAIIGARIRARRSLLGMSQERLGELINLTFQQVQKYERGVNRVSGSTFIKIAQALSCHVAIFFEGLDDSAAVLETPLSAEGIKLARRFDAITDPYVKDLMVRTLGQFERAPTREAAHAGE